MNIVFVMANNSSAPYFRMFMEEAARRKKDRFTFVAMTSSFPEMVREAHSLGLSGYWIPFDCGRRKSQMILAVLRLWRLFARIRPDVVHTHLFDDSLPALVAARLSRVKIRAVTKGDTGFHYRFANQWVVADRFVNWNATRVVAISSESEEFIRRVEKCPPEKVRMIHHGIPTAEFSCPDPATVEAFRLRWGFANRFVIGTVARLIEWKGYLDIIKVAEQVVKIIPEALFVWVGEGQQKAELERILALKNLNKHVILTGHIRNASMPSFYGAIDVFLHAAIMEPFGFVIAEAMAAGLPVVSTPTGAARDAIKHKENGWLGKYYAPESLSEGICHFYRHRQTKPFFAAQETAAKMFEFKMMYGKYLELYASRE